MILGPQDHQALRLTEKRSLIAALCAAALLYAIFIARSSFATGDGQQFTLIDDAMISMQFARHLAEGHGLVWNVGEPPIEGFTSLFWVAYLAIWHLLPVQESIISLAIMATNALVLMALGLVAARLARLLGGEPGPAGWIAAILTVFYFPLVFWSLRGMEAGLITLWISAGCIYALEYRAHPSWKPSLALATLTALALLTRPDAVPQLILLIAFVALSGGSDLRHRIHALAPLFMLAAVTALLTLWRLDYFGSPMPNTYYLKLTGATLSERMSVGLMTLLDNASVELVFALAVTALAWRLHVFDARVALVLALFLVPCAYSVYVGGDYAEVDLTFANRFVLQGVIPLFALCGVVASRIERTRWTHAGGPRTDRRSWRFIAAMGIVLALSGDEWARWIRFNAPMLTSDIWRARLGLQINRATEPAAVIASHAVGQIAYYSRRSNVDLLGKNDRFIATGPPRGPFRPGHNKWNYEYSIGQRRPDVVADDFGPILDYMKALDAEYELLPNGVWVLRTSTRVDRAELSRPFRWSRKVPFPGPIR